MKSASAKQPVTRRQDPISCKFCRLKKLRCNRQQPCSNCTARNVICERDGFLPASSNTSRPTLSSASNDVTTEGAILAKLDRLESLILKINESPSQNVSRTPDIPRLQQQPSPETVNTPFDTETPSEAAHKVDSKRLEDVTAVENVVLPGLHDGLCFKTLPVEHMVSPNLNTLVPLTTVLHPPRLVLLPTRQEALALLDIYAEHIDYMQHVLLLPKVRSQIMALYTYLEDQHSYQQPHASAGPLSPAALILAILASASAYIVEIRSKKSVSDTLPQSISFMTLTSARHCSIQWAKFTFECIEHARHINSLCLENVQAMIVSSFLIYNLEGFSARARAGFIHALGQARDLGLHRLDHKDESRKDRDPVDTEIARRVWWHMCASDWVLALSGGPQEGAYNIQPRHMQVNFPHNICDSDLLNPNVPADFEEPLHIPTSTSYLIQRIKLGTICRKIVDVLPLSPNTPDMVPYEDFIALDREFEKFLSELPPFYQVDYTSTPTNTKPQTPRQSPTTQQPPSDYISTIPSAGAAEPTHIATQRFMVRMTSHTRRCKLHQPFLVRGFTDPKYHYSRDVCLHSARIVLRIRQDLDASGLISTGLLALSGINHHLFFATIALVMDLCFNRTPGEERERERRVEVKRAMEMLEGAQERVIVVRRFLEGLRGVLEKYGVRLDDGEGEDGVDGGSELVEGSVNVSGEESGDCVDNGLVETRPSDFEEIWQTFVGSGGFDATGWEELFTELEP